MASRIPEGGLLRIVKEHERLRQRVLELSRRIAKMPAPYTPPAWQAFTLAWTAATTNPSIGNGLITARYVQLNKTTHVEVKLSVGSTTSLGSGAYNFSGYPTPKGDPVGSAYLNNPAEAKPNVAGIWRLSAGGSGVGQVFAPWTVDPHKIATMTDLSSFTPRSGGFMLLTATYEAA